MHDPNPQGCRLRADSLPVLTGFYRFAKPVSPKLAPNPKTPRGETLLLITVGNRLEKSETLHHSTHFDPLPFEKVIAVRNCRTDFSVGNESITSSKTSEIFS